MKTKHLHYSDDKCFCVVTVGADLTTYTYFYTLQEAQFHATSSKELLGMLGIEVEAAVFERREEPRIDGFKQHELN